MQEHAKRTRLISIIMTIVMAISIFSILSLFSGDLYSDAATKAKTPAKVTSLKIVKYSATKVKVTWKKAKNAKKYQIYRKAEGEKKFKLYKTTTKRSYVASQTKGRWYDYKVRGVNGKKYGKFSAIKGYRLKASPFISWSKSNILMFVGETRNLDVTHVGFNISNWSVYTYTENNIKFSNQSIAWNKERFKLTPKKMGKYRFEYEGGGLSKSAMVTVLPADAKDFMTYNTTSAIQTIKDHSYYPSSIEIIKSYIGVIEEADYFEDGNIANTPVIVLYYTERDRYGDKEYKYAIKYRFDDQYVTTEWGVERWFDETQLDLYGEYNYKDYLWQ